MEHLLMEVQQMILSSGFTQIYNAENPYYTTKEGEIRATMNNPLNQSLKVTALDVENSEAGIRTRRKWGSK